MKHVLVVEEDYMVALAFQRKLEHHGFRVSVARSSNAAIRINTATPVDLLLAELGLPDMNGQELLLRLRHNQPDLPGIIIVDVANAVTLIEDNTKLLCKPVNLRVMADMVKAMLGYAS